ncbi:MAG TPA: ABC transporter substrate-binding protein [Methylomirabilota bacterium]|nr:ABC transporter substrate-binding protein [Methylomirabilota bacterium]
MELHETTVSLDPREWKLGSPEFAINEKLAALVFDRLVTLDNYGRFQPQLAAEWSHDSSFKRWQFVLRANVKFSDGTSLTTADVVAALQPLLPHGQQISTAGNNVVIQSAEPMSDLLEELASGPFFIYRPQPDGTLLGAGPFVVTDSPASSSKQQSPSNAASSTSTPPTAQTTAVKQSVLHFRANEATWSGRPFLDSIEVTLGVLPLRQLFDLQLGRADLVELSPDLVRRAMQENQRIWSSTPVMMYGLAFDNSQPAASDAKLREAFSLSLDRETMANVLLQKQAEPAAALLPQWLSGYAFLFKMDTNIDRAKELRASLPPNAGTVAEPLRVRVDAAGDVAKLLGERVAVNARQALIPVQVLNRSPLRTTRTTTTSTSEPAAGLRLFVWHYSSLSPRVELETFVSSLNLGPATENGTVSADPEQLYARERKLLEDRRVLPLVALPEYVGLGRNVRDWMPGRWGEWHLADVWLDVPESGAGNAEGTSSELPTIRMGAKP